MARVKRGVTGYAKPPWLSDGLCCLSSPFKENWERAADARLRRDPRGGNDGLAKSWRRD
jgi:hypothetical protein